MVEALNAPPCDLGRRGHDMGTTILGLDFCRACGWVPNPSPTPDGSSPFRRHKLSRSSPRVAGKSRKNRVRALIARDGGGCHYCRCDLDDTTTTIDEVVPISRGGVAEIGNQVLACQPCNTAKGSLDYDDFVSAGRRG